ncbi:MAG: OmpA family protein [bacterium]
MDDYYVILGLRKPPSSKEIRAAYQRLVANYHPHIINELSKEEQARIKIELQKIKKAYQVLSDPTRRFQYDNSAFNMIIAKSKKVEKVKGKPKSSSTPTWLISYADMMTLLLAFFIMLFSFSTLGEKKVKEVLKSIKKTFNTSQLSDSLQNLGPKIDLNNLNSLNQNFIKSLNEMEKFLIGTGLEDKVIITTDERGKVITISDPFLFEEGKADINPDAYPLLDQISLMIKNFSSPVTIEGHTDNQPIHTERYPSNWELSIARAMSVLKRFTEYNEILPYKLSAAGYGEQMPIYPNDTQEHRTKNRRVEIVFKGWYK